MSHRSFCCVTTWSWLCPARTTLTSQWSRSNIYKPTCRSSPPNNDLANSASSVSFDTSSLLTLSQWHMVAGTSQLTHSYQTNPLQTIVSYRKKRECEKDYQCSKKLKTKNIPCIICCHQLKCLIVKWFYGIHTNYYWAKVPTVDEILSHTAQQRSFRLFYYFYC